MQGILIHDNKQLLDIRGRSLLLFYIFEAADWAERGGGGDLASCQKDIYVTRWLAHTRICMAKHPPGTGLNYK